MGSLCSLLGRRYGRLQVSRIAGRSKHGQVCWQCLCDCGSYTIVVAGALTSGNTRSCGCLRSDSTTERFTTHGHSSEQSPTYRSWYAMVQRCTNPNNKCFKNYGGSGIRVAKRWLTFSNFLKDMGIRPRDTTLGRLGDVGNYNPSNVKWMTLEEQTETRRKRRLK